MAYCVRFPVSWLSGLRKALILGPMLGRHRQKTLCIGSLLMASFFACGTHANAITFASHFRKRDQKWSVQWQNQPAISAHLDLTDGQHYVPLRDLAKLGWKYKLGKLGEATVSVGTNKVNIPYRSISQVNSVSLDSLCERLDFTLLHNDDQESLTILPRIEAIRYQSGELWVDASADLQPIAKSNSNGQLLVVVSAVALNPDLVTQLDPGVSITQLPDNSVQFLFDQSEPANESSSSKLVPGRHLDVNLSQITFASADTTAPIGPTKTSLTIKELPTHEIDLNIPIPHGPYSNLIVQQTGLQFHIDVPGIKLALDPAAIPKSDGFHRFNITNYQSNSQISFNLTKLSGVIVGVTSTEISIKIFEPNAGPNSLVNQQNMPLFGKLLVVDPGHGGKDTGAKNRAMGIEEKTLTLEIGSRLATTLAKQGATVAMTRIDDSYPTLADRCINANSNHGNLFLCVHINQINNPDFRGSITFYHTGRPHSLQLAEDVENQLADLNAIPSIGVWRDTRIAVHQGFYVLRNTKMPSILMELGFISNRQDVLALEDHEVQKQIAIAVTYGVEHYFKEHNN